MMDKKTFYEECIKIVGTKTEYTDHAPLKRRFSGRTGEWWQPTTRSGRWGGREPGNGRFPGLGLIRVFNPNLIQINIKNPDLSGTYKSYELALTALREIFSNETKELKVGDLIHVVLAGNDYGMCEIVKYDEEFDCWKVIITKTYSNNFTERVERYYPKTRYEDQ